LQDGRQCSDSELNYRRLKTVIQLTKDTDLNGLVFAKNTSAVADVFSSLQIQQRAFSEELPVCRCFRRPLRFCVAV